MTPTSGLARNLRELMAPFFELAEACPEFVGTVAGVFRAGGKRYGLPRFVWFGGEAAPGLAPVRIGLFAVLHGDEAAGALALASLAQTLADDPSVARGYDLVFYPICNPTGCEDGTRHNRAGADLNREFWHSSAHPEVRILERELREHRFDGLIALHADDTSEGLYGYAHDRLLNEELLRPALRASEKFLPRNVRTMIDGFAASDGVIGDCFKGILAPPPEQTPRPFEIIFETPARSPAGRQAEAAQAALLAILAEYRRFLAWGQNI
ncbi:MAG: succinylglutamate desuccinylase/aspartoacylase family protein [Opitutaceae bacterium]